MHHHAEQAGRAPPPPRASAAPHTCCQWAWPGLPAAGCSTWANAGCCAPARQLARRLVLRVVAQGDAGQRAQQRLGVAGADAEAQAHVRQQDAAVQRLVARHHAAHQHVAAAAGVFGEGVHRHIDAQALAVQVEGLKARPAPQVLSSTQVTPRARTGAPARSGRETPA
jgi:hypothetical protein